MPNSDTLAGNGSCAIGARVGRKLQYPEKREAAFPPGTLSRIDGVKREGESRADFIRDAVEKEILRRQA